jgi:hypothetical protein
VDVLTEGQTALDAAVSDVSAKADAIKAAVDVIVGTVDAIITKLQDVPSAPDFTQEVQSLQQVSDSLTSETAKVTDEETKAEAALGGGSTPPATTGVESPGTSGEAPPEPPPTGQ